MAGNNQDQILLEDCQIVFPNFQGKADDMNAEGNRNFCVLLNDEQAEDFKRRGLNVKHLKNRDEEAPEGELGQAYLNVGIKYRNRHGEKMTPPTVVVITSEGRQSWTEEIVGELDFVEIEKADLLIRTYGWDMRGRQGIKAVTKSLYVTIVEDVLKQKYRDVPEIGANRALTTGSSTADVIDVEWTESDDDQLALEG